MSEEEVVNEEFDECDDSTDSSEEEFIRQQKEKEFSVPLPRKSGTIEIMKNSTSVLVEDKNIIHDEFDSDDEDMNTSDVCELTK